MIFQGEVHIQPHTDAPKKLVMPLEGVSLSFFQFTHDGVYKDFPFQSEMHILPVTGEPEPEVMPQEDVGCSI